MSFRRTIPVQRRNTQPIMTHVTLQTRRSIEKLARQQDVSISELSRRLLIEAVAKNTEEVGV